MLVPFENQTSEWQCYTQYGLWQWQIYGFQLIPSSDPLFGGEVPGGEAPRLKGGVGGGQCMAYTMPCTPPQPATTQHRRSTITVEYRHDTNPPSHTATCEIHMHMCGTHRRQSDTYSQSTGCKGSRARCTTVYSIVLYQLPYSSIRPCIYVRNA